MKWRLGFAQRPDRGVTTFLLPREQAVRQGLAPYPASLCSRFVTSCLKRGSNQCQSSPSDQIVSPVRSKC